MTRADDQSSESALTGDAASERSSTAGLGDKLRGAREQRNLSIEQVAESLHLDETIISALEQGQFETLGAPVYVRGHLKAYTHLLGLSADEFIDNFSGDTPEPVVAPALRRTGIAPATINPILLAGGGLALLLGFVLGVYVLLGSDDNDEIVDSETVVAPVAESTGRQPSVDKDTVQVVRAAPVPEIREAVTVPEATADQPEPVVEVAAADDDIPPPVEVPAPRPAATMRLGLQFNQESWVEISDANRRLLFGLQREGNRREVTGEPPFNLLIGNASGVLLTVDDVPFDVPASGMRGKVARFEITGEEPE